MRGEYNYKELYYADFSLRTDIATILPVLYWLVFDKHGKYSLRKQ